MSSTATWAVGGCLGTGDQRVDGAGATAAARTGWDWCPMIRDSRRCGGQRRSSPSSWRVPGSRPGSSLGSRPGPGLRSRSRSLSRSRRRSGSRRRAAGDGPRGESWLKSRVSVAPSKSKRWKKGSSTMETKESRYVSGTSAARERSRRRGSSELESGAVKASEKSKGGAAAGADRWAAWRSALGEDRGGTPVPSEDL
jgi:hypothetical protein